MQALLFPLLEIACKAKAFWAFWACGSNLQNFHAKALWRGICCEYNGGPSKFASRRRRRNFMRLQDLQVGFMHWAETLLTHRMSLDVEKDLLTVTLHSLRSPNAADCTRKSQRFSLSLRVLPGIMPWVTQIPPAHRWQKRALWAEREKAYEDLGITTSKTI